MKVLSFNTWLLEAPIFGFNLAKDLNSRLKQLPQKLVDIGADIIFLQEVWKPKFTNFLAKELLLKGYYSSHDHTGKLARMGNGLMIFSKFPFNNKCDVFSFRNFTRADESFCKKGILIDYINHPKIGEILLANTHLGAANFNPLFGPNLTHLERQLEQKKELVRFLKSTVNKSQHFIFGADLNIHDHPWDIENKSYNLERLNFGYEMITQELNLTDSYRQIHSNKNDLNYKGDTYSSQNPYTKGLTNAGFSADERVDYLFIKKNGDLNVLKSETIFKDKLDSQHFLSDHYGVLSTLEY